MIDVFIQSPRGEARFSLPLGERLLDGCDEHRAAVDFSCRAGTCGTCRVEVLEGEALLAVTTEDEDETLARFGDGRTVRLACRLRAKGPGTVRLRVLDDP